MMDYLCVVFICDGQSDSISINIVISISIDRLVVYTTLASFSFETYVSFNKELLLPLSFTLEPLWLLVIGMIFTPSKSFRYESSHIITI